MKLCEEHAQIIFSRVHGKLKRSLPTLKHEMETSAKITARSVMGLPYESNEFLAIKVVAAQTLAAF
jgi:hypothetical protein